MTRQRDIGCRDNNVRRMTVTLPQTEPRANPISETNSSVQQSRRQETERTAYYYPRYRDNEWKLRGLPHNGRDEIEYDFRKIFRQGDYGLDIDEIMSAQATSTN